MSWLGVTHAGFLVAGLESILAAFGCQLAGHGFNGLDE